MLVYRPKYIIFGIVLVLLFSCKKNENAPDFLKFNNIINDGIIFSLENNCYKFSEYENKYKNKVLGLVVNTFDSYRIDSTINFVSFNINSFIKSSQLINFSKDSLSVSLNSNYKVFPTHFKELRQFIEYHSQFKEMELEQAKTSFIKTLIVRNPRIKSNVKTNEVLVEIDRFFEYIIDRTFLLITTDKSFNILKIECLDQVKPYIPPPLNQ
ncbi:MAG TPA: hypothetical protein PLC27_11725 [Saprospiraceae bacterium]|jgi:hypothetical protein|nr:hypothetical protein [Saprospiraceae bacterium]HMT72214.1 hypothetical protein [Saprospiraceae bacterium]HRG42069.1 hypothetical protein [Saprospiraceae bacterium]